MDGRIKSGHDDRGEAWVKPDSSGLDPAIHRAKRHNDL
jgi:hypothetical protein